MAGGGVERWAGWPLCVLLAAVPLVVVTGASDPYTRPKIIVLWVGLAVSFAVARAGGGRLAVVPWVDTALAAYLGWLTLATLFSVDPTLSFQGERFHHQGLATAVLYAGYFLVARMVGGEPQQRQSMALAVVVGLALVAAYGVAQHVDVDPYWGDRVRGERVWASLGQPNALGAYLMTALPLGCWVTAGPQWWSRAIGGVAVSLGILAMLWTESRGAYLAAFIALPLGAVAAHARWRHRVGSAGGHSPRTAVLAVTCSALVLLAIVISSGAASRATDRFSTLFEGRSEISARDHWDQWRVAVHVVREHPVVGTGLDTFPIVFPDASRAVLDAEAVRNFDQYRVESPHNSVLALAAGAGVPAVIAWLALGVAAGVEIRRRTSADWRFAVAGLASGYLLTSLFITADTTSSWVTWTLLGAGLATPATVYESVATRSGT